MKKEQKSRYEMFVRVRDFGAANSALFPASSTGGQAFARVAAGVAEIDGHLRSRVVARAEARKIKVDTRAAVIEAMKIITATGRRAVRREVASGGFRMPRTWSSKGLVDAAYALLDEARKREAEFVRLGLAPTFIADFTSLVERLEQAVTVRLNSSHNRRRDQAGFVAALIQVLEDIRELDVVVPNTVREDPARLAQWHRARRIDGHASSSRVRVAATPRLVVPPEPSSVDPPVADTTMPAVVDTGEEVTIAPDAGAAFPKAS